VESNILKLESRLAVGIFGLTVGSQSLDLAMGPIHKELLFCDKTYEKLRRNVRQRQWDL